VVRSVGSSSICLLHVLGLPESLELSHAFASSTESTTVPCAGINRLTRSSSCLEPLVLTLQLHHLGVRLVRRIAARPEPLTIAKVVGQQFRDCRLRIAAMPGEERGDLLLQREL
jgi:hypothetical protein